MAFARFASLPLLAVALITFGCHAQQPAAATPASGAQVIPLTTQPLANQPGTPLSPDLARRVEVELRMKANLPPETTVQVGNRTTSEFPGYDTVTVTVTNAGRTSRPILFLLSRDGKTLAQLTRMDISGDPKALVSGAGRPARGGGENAPVLIVGFDDLECPYCARLHQTIFPALTARYGDKVRFVYKDYPLEMHPWAMRAAIDTNCLGEQSTPAYWGDVDAIHARAGEIGTDPKDPKAEKTLARASEQLDALTREQGAAQKVDMTKLNACLVKQDPAQVNASKAVGESLNLDQTPTLFINGDKIHGAVSLEFLFGLVDQALRVASVQPPPLYVAPPPTTAPGTAPSGSLAAPAGS